MELILEPDYVTMLCTFTGIRGR